MEEAYNPEEAKREFIELMNYKMPFGKFKGQKLVNLPIEYFLWFKRKGFPPGKLGRFMEIIIAQKGG